MRHLIIGFRKVKDWVLKCSYRFEIWQAVCQLSCRIACQISGRMEQSKNRYRTCETFARSYDKTCYAILKWAPAIFRAFFFQLNCEQTDSNRLSSDISRMWYYISHSPLIAVYVNAMGAVSSPHTRCKSSSQIFSNMRSQAPWAMVGCHPSSYRR